MNIKKLTFILLILSVYNPVKSQNNNYIEAKRLFSLSWNENNTSVKEKHRFEIIKLAPQSEFGLFSKGWFEQKKKNFKEALKYYTKAIEVNPSFAEAYYSRGNLYGILNDNLNAINSLTKAIELKNNFFEAYISRAELYEKTNLFHKAIDDYNKAIEINPKEELVFILRGYSKSKLLMESNNDNKNYNEAIKDYNKALKLNQNNEAAYFYRAMLYHQMNLVNEAINDYSSVIKLNPKNYEAYYLRGKLNNRIGNHKSAVSDLTIACQFNEKQACDELKNVNTVYKTVDEIINNKNNIESRNANFNVKFSYIISEKKNYPIGSYIFQIIDKNNFNSGLIICPPNYIEPMKKFRNIKEGDRFNIKICIIAVSCGVPTTSFCMITAALQEAKVNE